MLSFDYEMRLLGLITQLVDSESWDFHLVPLSSCLEELEPLEPRLVKGVEVVVVVVVVFKLPLVVISFHSLGSKWFYSFKLFKLIRAFSISRLVG